MLELEVPDSGVLWVPCAGVSCELLLELEELLPGLLIESGVADSIALPETLELLLDAPEGSEPEVEVLGAPELDVLMEVLL